MGWLGERRGDYQILRPSNQEYTYFGYEGNGTVIDHIFGNAAARRLLVKAYVLGELDAAGSDHRMVVAEFRSTEGGQLTRAGRPMITSPSTPGVGD
jgi:hypothetical protein